MKWELLILILPGFDMSVSFGERQSSRRAFSCSSYAGDSHEAAGFAWNICSLSLNICTAIFGIAQEGSYGKRVFGEQTTKQGNIERMQMNMRKPSLENIRELEGED